MSCPVTSCRLVSKSSAHGRERAVPEGPAEPVVRPGGKEAKELFFHYPPQSWPLAPHGALATSQRPLSYSFLHLPIPKTKFRPAALLSFDKWISVQQVPGSMLGMGDSEMNRTQSWLCSLKGGKL